MGLAPRQAGARRGAPQGGGFARIEQVAGAIAHFPQVEVRRGVQAYYLSFWLRLNGVKRLWAMIGMEATERPRTCGGSFPGLPSTRGQWWPAWGTTSRRRSRPSGGGRVPGGRGDGRRGPVRRFRRRPPAHGHRGGNVGGLRGRAAPAGVRRRAAARDGRNLALSVAKWEGRAGLPGKPFLIWAVGSSWTNFQGDGYPLIRAIRERFPSAPPIVYKKHAGSGTPWDFARGWIRQFVNAEQPDLILTYTNGSLDGLDALLTEIRRSTTADVIVPSLHFFQGSKVTPESIEVFEGVPIEKVREVCRKHGAEFVENRRELAEYLQQAGLEPEALLGDAVHQNQHGRIRIWDNICRHIAKPAFNYAPESASARSRPMAWAADKANRWSARATASGSASAATASTLAARPAPGAAACWTTCRATATRPLSRRTSDRTRRCPGC